MAIEPQHSGDGAGTTIQAPGQSAMSGRHQSTILATVLLVLLAGALGYVIGQRSQSAKPPATADRTPAQPNGANSAPVAPKVTKTKPVILNALNDTDLETLTSGCMCSFGQDHVDFLYLNADMAMLRPNGRLLVSPMDSSTFERLYNDGGAFQAKGYALNVEPFGPSESGYEVHASQSRLTIATGGQSRTIEGRWICAC